MLERFFSKCSLPLSSLLRRTLAIKIMHRRSYNARIPTLDFEIITVSSNSLSQDVSGQFLHFSSHFLSNQFPLDGKDYHQGSQG